METPSSNVFPPISRASVKVMRSHDYCHFEVVLGTENDVMADITPAQVDNLRKEAARLADKAVEQYKIAKGNASKLLREKQNREYFAHRVERIRQLPEEQRDELEKADLKAFDDQVWQEGRRYDYDEDWPDDSDED